MKQIAITSMRYTKKERLCDMEQQKPKKEGRFFQKGHPYYGQCKTVDAGDFILVLNAYIKGMITMDNAAEMLNVSVPTYRKWIRIVGEHGSVDKELEFLVWADDVEEQKLDEMMKNRAE